MPPRFVLNRICNREFVVLAADAAGSFYLSFVTNSPSSLETDWPSIENYTAFVQTIQRVSSSDLFVVVIAF